jgi:hypothetical protein
MRIQNRIIGTFLVILIACWSPSCNKSLPPIVSTKSLDQVIYWEGSDSGFTSRDFDTIVKLSNGFPERYDNIPSSIGYKLTLNEAANASYFCKFINLDETYPLGQFSMQEENEERLFLVTFTNLGNPVDFMGIKSCTKNLSGEKIKSRKYYSKLSYTTDGRILVSILDTTKIVEHPDLAKIIRKDLWKVDDSGRFIRL